MMLRQKPFHLKLPATSANLGPGFDALGLAMSLYLTLEARVAEEFSIEATGRDAEVCGRLVDNLMVETYRDILRTKSRVIHAISVLLRNEIPLGMGCGSSAAALLAGVCLANHFGELGWTGPEIMREACRREGHPDNVAACWRGGMTASAMREGAVFTATCGELLDWKLMLVLPTEGLSTAQARALLPAAYSREDAVANVQATALLVAAFAQDRPELLRVAMEDRMHQPYRSGACPLLPLLLPLRQEEGVYGVALSGAGPAVLLVVDPRVPWAGIVERILQVVAAFRVEILHTSISAGGQELSAITW